MQINHFFGIIKQSLTDHLSQFKNKMNNWNSEGRQFLSSIIINEDAITVTESEY